MVRLHFAEIWWTTAGSRLFNVSLDGVPVLTNFDVFAAAGGADRAIVEPFTVPADAGGGIAIQFTTVKDNAKVSGIEILGPWSKGHRVRRAPPHAGPFGRLVAPRDGARMRRHPWRGVPS